MSDLALIRQDLAAVAAAITPWVSAEEMMRRYDVKQYRTLAAMEARGEIPRRVNGRWSRIALMQWEDAQIKKAA